MMSDVAWPTRVQAACRSWFYGSGLADKDGCSQRRAQPCFCHIGVVEHSANCLNSHVFRSSRCIIGECLMGDERPGPRAHAFRHVLITAALLLGAAGFLAGCASAPKMGDYIPTAAGGLPEGTPERSTTPGAYPAVHDMPPRRESTVLTSAEQKQLEDDLAAARKRAETATGSSGQSTGSVGKQ
jgi:hypothetical protein